MLVRLVKFDLFCKKMRFLFLYIVILSFVIVQSHEFKGFTLKFLYQVFTGDFINLKRREKIEKNVLKNETSSYLGKLNHKLLETVKLSDTCYLIVSTLSINILVNQSSINSFSQF